MSMIFANNEFKTRRSFHAFVSNMSGLAIAR